MRQDIVNQIISQDYSQIAKNIQEHLCYQVTRKKLSGVIFGLSGGIDSAVIAALCSRALKKKTLAIVMPDSYISPNSETNDALNLVDDLNISYKLIDIKPIIKEFSKYLEPDKKAQGNLRARIRTNILYYYANTKNYLVLGSSDKSEWLIGYFTKFGDGASDMAPIISLYKLQVRKMAEYLKIPRHIISKKSSPYLWKNHLAEEEIGYDYEQIDSILYCMFEKKMSVQETANICNVEKKTVHEILQLNKNSEHKRYKVGLEHENS